MMTDTSFFTFSAGRVETKTWDGSRLRPSGSVFVVFGLASAKQTLLPPGEAAYAPQSPYWPSKVGCASPAGAEGAAAVAAGLDGAAAGFCGCGVAAGFCGCCCGGLFAKKGRRDGGGKDKCGRGAPHPGHSPPSFRPHHAKAEPPKQARPVGEFRKGKGKGTPPPPARHNIQTKNVIPLSRP